MNIFITGSTGQLGRDLILNVPKGFNIIEINRDLLDFRNLKPFDILYEKYKPNWIINCAAFTSVENAEIKKEESFMINYRAPSFIADKIKSKKTRLLQISTDYVFDGIQTRPYLPNSPRNPLNIYGHSKAAAEKHVEETLCFPSQAIILRTSWLVSPYGNNFVTKILKLLQTNKEINVINDQYGALTSTSSLAKACWASINYFEENCSNNINIEILHWTCKGVVSWYEIAIAIKEIAEEIGLIEFPGKILPVSTLDYPSKVNRPLFSVLDCTSTAKKLKIDLLDWKNELFNIILKVSKINKK